ncbi:putative pyridoxamine 5'-phosphate oxidase family protein [Anaerosolibacter carboniphilus]|uniref:Putative pyridoxamine 5'-phosphate oxidase family protein n=1 Tax=Anaerosolibacter carboniphilus TaxID=1417629 RepID=A0A841KYA0_9FIRM|nr:pyridoxamine 5'-phosphate oxidase family protein [Anaerosolibacter carboniphilus]MBB6218604.1 putative pyridoxamine 5'-phosphate oxidase family protein [Anaerosolibacter carboniphilus]
MSRILGSEIPQEAIEFINKENAFMVLATINCETGFPHTTPINLVKIPSPSKIYACIARGHQAYENIKHDGRVMISLLAEGDIALSIKGEAAIIKESMEGNQHMVGLQIDVIEVKSDTTATVKIERGIEVSQRSQKTPQLFRAIYDELERF